MSKKRKKVENGKKDRERERRRGEDKKCVTRRTKAVKRCKTTKPSSALNAKKKKAAKGAPKAQ